MQNFGTLHSGILVMAVKKIPKIVAYLSCSAGRMHFARTKLGPCKISGHPSFHFGTAMLSQTHPTSNRLPQPLTDSPNLSQNHPTSHRLTPLLTDSTTFHRLTQPLTDSPNLSQTHPTLKGTKKKGTTPPPPPPPPLACADQGEMTPVGMSRNYN